MIKIKDYIGTKSFYKMTLSIAVPMMVQNLISNFVSLLDNVMVGSLGTEEMSGVSIVNQLFFVFTLALFGAVSGAGIFTSQFHGKNDHDGIRYTIRFKTITVILLTVIDQQTVIASYRNIGDIPGHSPDQIHALIQRKHGILRGIDHDADDQTVKDTGRSADDVQMACGDRVKAARIDRITHFVTPRCLFSSGKHAYWSYISFPSLLRITSKRLCAAYLFPYQVR